MNRKIEIINVPKPDFCGAAGLRIQMIDVDKNAIVWWKSALTIGDWDNIIVWTHHWVMKGTLPADEQK